MDDRVYSEEECGPAEVAQEPEIGSVPTENAEESATLQETIGHSETAVEAATRQEILQIQLTREAGARKKGREELNKLHSSAKRQRKLMLTEKGREEIK